MLVIIMVTAYISNIIVQIAMLFRVYKTKITTIYSTITQKSIILFLLQHITEKNNSKDINIKFTVINY